ncbi:MAG: hypothetical protein V7722_05865 [Porticoccus sp.]
MKRLVMISTLLLCISCTQEESDPVFEWGALPSMEMSYFEESKKCKGITYERVRFVRADIKDTLKVQGENVSGVGHSILLGDTCLQGSISTRVFLSKELQSKNYYSISIQAPIKYENSILYMVLFQRDLSNDQIGDYFKSKSINSIVIYNQMNNTVTFKLENQEYNYELPNL